MNSFFFLFTYNFTLLFILFLFTSVILGVVKIGGPYFDGTGPWTGSTEGVHGPGHVLYFPFYFRVMECTISE